MLDRKTKMAEKNLEAENASPAEQQRNAFWEMHGYIKAQNCAKLRGRIISDRFGTQAVETDSKEEGKRIIHCLGLTYIQNGKVGDWVELEYRVHALKNVCMWVGRLIAKGNG